MTEKERMRVRKGGKGKGGRKGRIEGGRREEESEG